MVSDQVAGVVLVMLTPFDFIDIQAEQSHALACLCSRGKGSIVYVGLHRQWHDSDAVVMYGAF